MTSLTHYELLINENHDLLIVVDISIQASEQDDK